MMNYIDAHIHIADCKEWQFLPQVFQCSSCHTEKEFLFVESLSQKYPNQIFPTFGIHPQNPDTALFSFLEQLAAAQRIVAVGEAGFDFFTSELGATWKKQQEVWQFQLELAQKYQLPLVIHCRKAMDKIFLYCKELALLPAVVFHAFPGSCQEAHNLLQRGIEGYFSFGKELLRGRKNSRSCVQMLPQERLLAETDAPYQTLRNEEATASQDIVLVYQEFAKIRGIPEAALKNPLEENFQRIFTRKKSS
jgi:TatD DNase family protein